MKHKHHLDHKELLLLLDHRHGLLWFHCGLGSRDRHSGFHDVEHGCRQLHRGDGHGLEEDPYE